MRFSRKTTHIKWLRFWPIVRVHFCFQLARELVGSRGHHHRTIHDPFKQVTSANPHCFNLVTCVPYIVTTGEKNSAWFSGFKGGCATTKGPIPPRWVGIPMWNKHSLYGVSGDAMTKHTCYYTWLQTYVQTFTTGKGIEKINWFVPQENKIAVWLKEKVHSFFKLNSKGIRNQASEVPSAFPGGTPTISQKWVLWTLEWIHEGLRNTIHWERNLSTWEKRATLPKLFLAFCFKGWGSECRQKLQEWKPDTGKKLSGSVSGHRCLCMTVALLQSACDKPSKMPFKNQAFLWQNCTDQWIVSLLTTISSQQVVQESRDSESHGVRSLIEAG